MIELDGVSYRVGGSSLVEDVSLEAEPGKVLAVVGPNGAGKSTLLRLMTGELLPSAGEVRMGGNPLATWRIRERARVRAVLPQTSDLAFPFSVFDVVLLGRSPHGEGDRTLHDHAIARLALSATDALAYEDRPYPTLSGGERQRVHAARALAQVWEGEKLRVLVMDEPTASLDLSHQHDFLAQARTLAERGCTIICVLHDLNLAAQYADTVAVMRGGRLHAVGAPSRILSTELVRDVFDVEALVVPHPELSCALVVPTRRASRARASSAPGVL